ncbi:hypothetical protein MUO65_05865 [bacterium]|nr:hypothetical protein [bacterium]
MFESLETLIFDQCKPKGFILLGPISERHGSWEWTFFKKGPDLNRFIIIALTNLGEALEEHSFESYMGIWIGAEDDNCNRFVRRSIQEFRFTPASLESPTGQERIKKSISRAIDFANRLSPADLVEVSFPKKFILSSHKTGKQ